MSFKTEKIEASELPFRQGVGMVIVDKNNRVFVGKRIDSKVNGWQMPQGGIDLGETPSSAALREMEEEIGSSKGKIIAESKKCYSYRVPNFLIPRLWNGKY
ncbi:MAG: NUDIX domain-containing protein, partial [Rickettsiaceae bacterium]|nr:NUDIX domain-containing protein [Rickettsiaceae bacterium]